MSVLISSVDSMEVVAISEALGYKTITAELAEKQLGRALERKGGTGIEPSMLVDVLWGRRMEVEVILGNIVRKGRERGVAVPTLECCYAMVLAVDQRLARERERERDGTT